MAKPRTGPHRAERERQPTLSELRLPGALASKLSAGHPWVYKSQVPAGFSVPEGSWLRVRAGAFAGYGVWDDSSQVAVRIFSRKSLPDSEWVRARVEEAWQLRRPLLESGVSAFRLVYGEGDALPGIVVDYYAGYCLLMVYSPSLEQVASWVTQAVMTLDAVVGVVRRSSAGKTLQLLAGRAPPPHLVISEGRYRLAVDLRAGQKSGLFLDHRDNRNSLSRYAADATVLNLFCYTGAFSLAALAGGAMHVTSVDSAAPSVAAARDNFRLNGHDPDAHDFEVSDVFEYLELARQRGARFDLVISDPPSFAKRREQLAAALKAYRRLSVMGIRVTKPGGWYVAASCTSQVGAEQFQRMLAEAAQRSNRRLQVLHEAAHPPDHPIFIAHPEGRYLKFVITRVLEPC